jgi:hypothetical protein
MSVKQDRTGVRTAVDLERKYNFGKTFADMLGLINDSRDKVDSVESELRDEILEQSTSLRRDTAEIVATATQTVKTDLSKEIEGVEQAVVELKENVETKIDSEGVSIAVNKAIQPVKAELTESINGVNEAVVSLEKEVEMKVDSDGVSILVEQKIANGVEVDRVTTKTGYTFDSAGLTIGKEGEEIYNQIDNKGMYVRRGGVDMLTANNAGVGAVNLHAKTYLIIGSGYGRSRFEDYGASRTGCFWVG